MLNTADPSISAEFAIGTKLEAKLSIQLFEASFEDNTNVNIFPNVLAIKGIFDVRQLKFYEGKSVLIDNKNPAPPDH